MTGPSAALPDLWTAQRKWSAVADEAGDRLDTWRLVNLGLLVLGALLGVLAAQASLLVELLQIWTTLAGAGVLIAAAVVQRVALRPVGVEQQAVARAVSEALKAETFRYLAGVAPYAGADRDAVLGSALPLIMAQAGAGLDERYRRATSNGRPPPAVTDVDSYLAVRAVGQRTWHRDRVVTYARRARRLRNGELAATVAAALLAVATGAGVLLGAVTHPDIAAWVGLATTVGAAFAAHLSATRADKIASGYARTVEQLTRLIDARDPAAATPESDAEFVVRVEQTLARQNDSWISLITS